MVNSSNPLAADAELQQFDAELYALVGNIQILNAVSPLNYGEQKQRFLDSNYIDEPEFIYKTNTIDAFSMKRQLFNLPIESIQDPDLHALYLAVINSYVDKIDQFKSVGSPDFLYNSLRYYGEPTVKDIRNAQFILHLPENQENPSEAMLGAQHIHVLLEDFAKKEDYTYTLKIEPSMIANALVSGSVVKINSSACITQTEAMALAHHELGVHLVTTLNARSQPLKVLSLGCPVNTLTQEGMAILSEYLAGCMTIQRLKILALRVLAVESMIKEKRFRNTFLLLKEQYHVDDQQAFTITARAYRGGGFTKDCLYLKGFHQVLNAYEQSADFLHLLVGKTSLDFLPTISRLIEKQLLLPPQKITPAFANPVSNDAIKQFVTHAIK